MRRRSSIAAVALLAAGGLGVYGCQRLERGGRVTPIGVDEAVERYRDEAAATDATAATTAPATTTPATTAPATTAPTAPATTTPVTRAPVASATLPAPGVYVYVTSGFDAVDVLTGARHDYPEATTLTVTASGCGVRLRWDVAVERWDTRDWCLEGAGMRETAMVSYHEFFGVGGRHDYVCTGDARPLDADPGTTWSWTCVMGDTDTTAFEGVVVERTTLDVAGEPVAVSHVSVTAEVTGESSGQHAIEGWYRTTDGLPVLEVGSISTVQPTPLGDTNFTEEYSIALSSSVPIG